VIRACRFSTVAMTEYTAITATDTHMSHARWQSVVAILERLIPIRRSPGMRAQFLAREPDIRA
jgi:hypothetical protein